MFGKNIERKYHQDGTQPQNNEIFVFGSNTHGIHGGGAAKAAREYYGAIQGKGVGRHGRSFAIPTKGFSSEEGFWTLSLDVIRGYTEKFVVYTKTNPDLRFFVTAVGCGLAGLTHAQMAPLFIDAINCSFPEEWKQYLDLEQI